MTEWQLLYPEQTYEDACEHGARWTRPVPNGVESFWLPAGTIERIGHMPSPAEAYDHHRMDLQWKRLEGDRERMLQRLADEDRENGVS